MPHNDRLLDTAADAARMVRDREGEQTQQTPTATLGLDLHAWARRYAEHGWAVFPVKPRDKRPLTANGFKDATTDPAQIADWWQQWPDANIGHPVPDGCLVVDVDPRHDGTVASLGAIPHTVTTVTGSGGTHHYFHTPAGVRLTGKFRDLQGVDVRKPGNYVLLPPSVHANGRRYYWKHPPFGEAPLAALPTHLLDKVREPDRTVARAPAAPVPSLVRATPALRPADPAARARYYLESAIERSADDGRNASGFWLACQLRDNGLTREEAEPWLLEYQAAVENAGDHPYTVEEALQSLAQAYGREPRDPTTFGVAPSPEKQGRRFEALHALAAATGDVAALERALALPPAEAFSDLGDAALLEACFGQVLRHTPELGWLHYRDGQWRATDGEKAAQQCARQVLDGLAQQAAVDVDSTYGKKLYGHTHRACDRLPSIVSAASSFDGLSAHQSDFDREPHLFGTRSGVVDLRTGALLPHSPAHMLTHQSPVAYDPHAHAPRWDRFLEEITAGDTALMDFMRRAVGYSMTGETREQAFFLAHGNGANGKSVFLGAVSHVLGDYSAPLNPDEFMTRFNRAETQPNLVSVVGRRLVTSQEPKEGGGFEKAPALDAARVKWLTGEDAIQIRTLHSKPFFYRPVWTLWLAMNRLPAIPDDTEGIWRRLRSIRFLVSFRGREDPRLAETLRGEAEGILAWAARGAREWYAEGLGTAPSIEEDVTAYRIRENPLFAFITERLVHEFGATVPQSEVLTDYAEWAALVNDDYDAPAYKSARAFGAALEGLGIRRERATRGRVLANYRLRRKGEESDTCVANVANGPFTSNSPIAHTIGELPENDQVTTFATSPTTTTGGNDSGLWRDEDDDDEDDATSGGPWTPEQRRAFLDSLPD
jgi:putative DNA primase/helicase